MGKGWEKDTEPIHGAANIKRYLVFKIFLLQVLNISDHLMDDWVKHGLEKQNKTLRKLGHWNSKQSKDTANKNRK